MVQKSYIKGAGIIAAGGLIAKLLGLFFKIPIGRILDSFGYGLYYNSYNIYNLLLTISIVGIPVAISKMVAERASVKNYYGVSRVFNISMIFLIVVGTITSLIMFFGANAIINIAGWDKNTYYSLIGLALAPFFVSILCGFRGFFQGMQLMAPSAISQIIEAFARVFLGIGLCIYLTNNLGQPEGAGGASSGALWGALAAALFLAFSWYVYMGDFKKDIKRSQSIFPRESTKKLFKRLLQIAIPVTIASAIVSLFGIINSFTYVSRLQSAGIGIRQATIMFGDYGLAQTMINVPLTFSAAMSITLVPAISESFALKNKEMIKYKTEMGIWLILLISLPCAIGLSVFSQPIFQLLFPNSVYGGGILTYFAFSTILIMFANTLQSVLQGLDKLTSPVKHLIPGLIVNYIFNYIFVSIPAINIYGLVISNIAAYLVVATLNYISVKKYTGVKIHLVQTVVKPVIASLAMGISGVLIYKLLNLFAGNGISVLVSIALCIIIYVVALIGIKGITQDELSVLPARNKLRKILEKYVR